MFSSKILTLFFYKYMLVNNKFQQNTNNNNLYNLFKEHNPMKEHKISEIFQLVYDKNTQKSIETEYNENLPVMKMIKLYYNVIGEKMPSTKNFEHGFIKTILFMTQIEFVQFNKENYFFFIHTNDEIVKLIYNMVFPFELLFEDQIPKNRIKIQNIIFDKTKLFRDYFSIDSFLRQFHKFEKEVHSYNSTFNFRKELSSRINLNKYFYKYYGLCINGNLYDFLKRLYNFMINEKMKEKQIYPTTFLQNDYVTKIYSCIQMKIENEQENGNENENEQENENENEQVYLKLCISKYLLKDGKVEK